MQQDLEEIIKLKLRNPEKIIMTKRDWRTHKSAIKCYICEGKLQETRYNKVKYFDSTRKFIGGAHHGCVKIKCEATEENLSEAVYRTEGLSIEEENTFKKATKCCLCKISLRADINDNRVRDHDHFTRKYRGLAHHRCNLLLRIKPDEIKIPLIYHGGKHYDFHHEIWELGLVSEDKIEIIADNMENYKTIIIGQIKFIDSCQFQFPSVEKVANNLRGQERTPEQLAKCFPIIAQSIPQHLLSLLTQKSEYPYELKDPDCFSRTELPSRKEFNTVLGGLNYCENGCKKCKHEIKGKKCNGECKEDELKETDDCEHEKIYTISQKQYDHAQNANKWLLYLDANNLYGWAMSQYLPTGGFRWLDLDKLPDVRSISPTAKRGSAWEVKLKYLEHLHPIHTDYPLCPERQVVKRQELGPHQNNNLIDKLSGGKFAETEKLVATLETKD
ncbi:hypothetical protein RclHR1_31740002 [Rhizophagus clarus]|uniref:DNA-directed DNA polymerase n=1 Tax=Rhizophagus clarus TaxID=94130 RepID=A0A2Z6RJH4_9GLOM|nr:hypothetical protein RclHR1_31740002 [Rhizophagus clarus]